MRKGFLRRSTVFLLAAALFVPTAQQGVAAPGGPPRLVPAATLTAAMQVDGRVVRRTGDATVERLHLPASAPSKPLWRVTVRGTYPPRALRYELLADGHPIAFGVPSANERSLVAISSDPAVLSASLSTRYGDAKPARATSGRSASMPTPRYAGRDLPSVGSFAVTRAVYNLGDQVFQPSGIQGKVELKADVHYPTGLPGGPYPLVLFMHGNHSTCWKGTHADYRWPCRQGWHAIPNYAGYDYIASRLASFGFIVVSVSANGVNVLGNQVDDTGMMQRGEVLEKHIDLWNTWNSTGGDPFGTTFVGKVDMSRIGTMGHSRGGEGVVWNDIVDQQRPDPYGIDAILALAPVDFTRQPINDVPFAVMLPYCDGDVSDLQGIHYFDDSRYLVPGDPTPKSTVTVFGANHNFFNTVWSPGGGYPGAFDDGKWTSCQSPLTQKQERKVGATYIVSFFRRYLTGDTSLDPIWTGALIPSNIAPARTLVSYLAPDTPSTRLDVDRFTATRSLGTDELGGPVATSGLSLFGWCSDAWQTPCVPGNNSWYDVHLSFSWFATDAPGLQQGIFGWSSTGGAVRFALPGGEDVQGFDALQFRAATNPGYFANRRGGIQDLAVTLVDGNGDRATVVASDIGNDALAYPIGNRGSGHYILNQLRFPLDRFRGIDQSDIRSVEIGFTRTNTGVVNVADLAFSGSAA
jgi:hypothetical protein